MTYAQVKDFFKDKKDEVCTITDKLVEGGYRQKRGGYIRIAKELNIESPTQWWHIMNHCYDKEMRGIAHKTYRYTPCGELVFWMAEVSKAVDKEELVKLKDKIIQSQEVDKRRKWNKEIKEVCWTRICEKIDRHINCSQYIDDLRVK
ncbi:MAG: hypothetical protein IJX86_05905 [Lachnospiraceae bacterium]|nr:hypothetical protein [Lachnospiraceae bacterium]